MSRYAAQDRHHRRIGRTDQTKGNARHFKQIAMMQPPRFRQPEWRRSLRRRAFTVAKADQVLALRLPFKTSQSPPWGSHPIYERLPQVEKRR